MRNNKGTMVKPRLLHKERSMNVAPVKTGKRGRPRFVSCVGSFVGSVCCLRCDKVYLKFLSSEPSLLPEEPFPVIFDRLVDFLYVSKFAKLASFSEMRFRLVFNGKYDHVACEHFPFDVDHAYHVRRVFCFPTSSGDDSSRKNA